MNKPVVGEIYLYKYDIYENLVKCLSIEQSNDNKIIKFIIIKNIYNSANRLYNIYTIYENSYSFRYNYRLLTPLEKIKYL